MGQTFLKNPFNQAEGNSPAFYEVVAWQMQLACVTTWDGRLCLEKDDICTCMWTCGSSS